MSLYRMRNRMLLAAVQSVAGTEASPTPAANAVRINDLQFTPNFESLDTSSEVTGSLSVPAPVAGGGNVGMTMGAYLKGAGTPGNAPDYGPLLQACGFAETLTAADVTGTAQAGAADTITLAVEDVATDDAYTGMVIEITGGTGEGQIRVVTDFVASSKLASIYPDWETEPDDTSEYTVHANALYKPASTGLKVVTLWAYEHHNDPAQQSRLRRLFDGSGTFTLSVAPRGFGQLSFTVTGALPEMPSNVAKPSAPVYNNVDPVALMNAQAYLGGSPVKFSEFSLDLGADVQAFDDPSAQFGYDQHQIVMRRPTGRIVPNLTLLSSRNAFSDWLGNTSRPLWLHWGAVAGKRVSLWFPGLRYTGNEQVDVRGFVAEGIPFQATGLDSEVYISLS